MKAREVSLQEYLRRPVLAMAFRPAECEAQQDSPVVVAKSEADVHDVRVAELGGFLRSQRNAIFLCCNAARLHWHLLDSLERIRDRPARRELWRVSRENRFLDISLVDQRLLTARTGRYAIRRTLAQLAADYAVPDETSGASQESILILHVWPALRASLPPASSALQRKWRRFGPLAIGIDVQGEIAQESIKRRSIRINMTEAEKAYQAAQQFFEENSRLLWKDPAARHQFKWSGFRG